MPATSANLGPGFDTLGLALNLYNRVEMDRAEPGTLEVLLEGEGAGSLTADWSNLALRAADLVFRQRGGRPPGLRVRIVSSIPLARGLGSSATAVVGGILAADGLTGGGMSAEEALNLAASLEGHADNVAPALCGGMTISWRNERGYGCLRLEPPLELGAVAAIPTVPMPTARARAVLPEKVPLADAVFNTGRAALLVAAVTTGRLDLLREATMDRLHQPYREKLLPGFREAVTAALEVGALGAFLSGAGSSVLALIRKNDGAKVGEAMEGAFRQKGVGCATRILCPTPQGATVSIS